MTAIYDICTRAHTHAHTHMHAHHRMHLQAARAQGMPDEYIEMLKNDLDAVLRGKKCVA